MTESWEFSQNILQGVSRTFALNINILQGMTRKAVLTGYLLFRIADCLEDSLFQSEPEKAANLKEFASLFENNEDPATIIDRYGKFKNIWKKKSAEENLMKNGEKVLEVYFSLPDRYREILSRRIAETSRGMAEFQLKKEDSEVYQLKDIRELKEYCYYVAGVVGKMLTEIFALRKRIEPLKSEMDKYDDGFGEGLQVTNIAKDWKKDLERGWMYVPSTLAPIEEPVLDEKEIVIGLCRIAFEGLKKALHYINLIPVEENDIRLFCIIPFSLACATLLKIASFKGNKISRVRVYKLLKDSERCSLKPGSLENMFKRFSAKLEKNLPLEN